MALPIKINLPEGFLQPEIKCGFQVPEKLKKIWAVELDLLKRFDELCTKHGIRYQAYYGTLLGAIRHKGFIPWDDDMDVIVDRENFNKLLAISEEEIEAPYYLQSALNDDIYFSPLMRFRNSETTGLVRGQEDVRHNSGIYIDIFVFDGLTQSKCKYKIQTVLKHLVLIPLMACYREENSHFKCLGGIFKLFGKKFWYRIYSGILSMYTNESTRLGLVAAFDDESRRAWISKEEFGALSLMPYEFLTIPCSKSFDQVLRRDYGDYLSFPPIEDRGKWHEGVIQFEPEIPYRKYLTKGAINRYAN